MHIEKVFYWVLGTFFQVKIVAIKDTIILDMALNTYII